MLPSPPMLRAASLALLLVLPSLAGPAFAGEAETKAKALDLVYEAADAIDSARAELKAGREREAERLLTRAEEYLTRAEALVPGLARVAFERARLQETEGEEALALQTLEGALAGELPGADHLRGIELVDALRDRLGKPSLGADWRRANTSKNLGGALLGGGLALSLAGLGVAMGTFAHDVYNGVTDAGIGGNRVGWALCIVGAGIGGVGGGVVIGAQVRLDQLKLILPGPWRLPGGSQAQAAAAGAPPALFLSLRFDEPAPARR